MMALFLHQNLFHTLDHIYIYIQSERASAEKLMPVESRRDHTYTHMFVSVVTVASHTLCVVFVGALLSAAAAVEAVVVAAVAVLAV